MSRSVDRAPVALVTGGNRGIGLETCRQLGRRGMRVVLTARRADDGRRAAAELATEGHAVEFRSLDVADPEGVVALARDLAAEDVAIDVLVNNAAVALDGFDTKVVRRTLAANFYGPLRVADALVPLMPDGARIVMVSSGAGELSGFGRSLRQRFLAEVLTRDDLIALMNEFVAAVERGRYRDAGWPGSAYKVSKAGLNALTRVLARELAGRLIKVNAVCPGWVRTDMGGRAASRGVAEGAASVIWAATLDDDGPTSGFFRDGRRIQW